MDMKTTLVGYMDILALGLAVFGVLVVLIAGVKAAVRYVRQQARDITGKGETDYRGIRNRFGEEILLGLEFFVGADIIKSIATPSFVELGLLASIVAIRIALSYFLSREMGGFGSSS